MMTPYHFHSMVSWHLECQKSPKLLPYSFAALGAAPAQQLLPPSPLPSVSLEPVSLLGGTSMAGLPTKKSAGVIWT